MDNNNTTHTPINANVTLEEIKKVIHKLKLNKSTGLNGIQNECIKQPDVTIIIWKLISLLFTTSLVPTVWLKAIIQPISKGSDKDPFIPLNYRGISLLSCVSKTYTSFLNNRLIKHCEENDIIADEQNGFRKGRSCSDHIFSLASIIKNRLPYFPVYNALSCIMRTPNNGLKML